MLLVEIILMIKNSLFIFMIAKKSVVMLLVTDGTFSKDSGGGRYCL